MAYAELLPDERQGASTAFMGRSLVIFGSLGVGVERVLTDNGSGCRSREFNGLHEVRGAK